MVNWFTWRVEELSKLCALNDLVDVGWNWNIFVMLEMWIHHHETIFRFHIWLLYAWMQIFLSLPVVFWHSPAFSLWYCLSENLEMFFNCSQCHMLAGIYHHNDLNLVLYSWPPATVHTPRLALDEIKQALGQTTPDHQSWDCSWFFWEIFLLSRNV